MSDELQARLIRRTEEYVVPALAQEIVWMILAEIRAQGKVIVPREPTDRMIMAGRAMSHAPWEAQRASYQAMFKAAEEKP